MKLKNRICPVEKAGHLDASFRKWLQDPRKILSPFIQKGMTVIDAGCGPGFFTIEIARMVGPSGRVIAVDLQEGMLQKVRQKLQASDLKERVTLVKGNEDGLGVKDRADFILAFYVVHEVQNKLAYFEDIAASLRKNGHLLIVEPPLHVSKKAFKTTVQLAGKAGLEAVDNPRVFFSRTALMKRI